MKGSSFGIFRGGSFWPFRAPEIPLFHCTLQFDSAQLIEPRIEPHIYRFTNVEVYLVEPYIFRRDQCWTSLPHP